MTFDSDVALLGTGVAPLVAANHLLIQGKSVLLLNPDWDFFQEDSELPLDPMLLDVPSPEQIQASSPESALEALRPDFPGAIELWSPDITQGKEGFHDSSAPHVKKRSRLWVSTHDKNRLWNWSDLEDLYVRTSDAGLDPQISEGLPGVKNFPGISFTSGNYRSLTLPKICDVDLSRYRNGLLEFVRERLGAEKVVCALNQLELMPGGIRFYAGGTPHNAKLKEGALVFWTPRLNAWILNQARKMETTFRTPLGIRCWEQWSLNSREKLDPTVIGMFGDMAVWADFEGSAPLKSKNSTLTRLNVLRTGPLKQWSEIQTQQASLPWASSESFGALSNLCKGFLKWDRFSVQSLKVRTLFEWEPNETKSWQLNKGTPPTWIIPGCDGPLIQVVQEARKACSFL